jgi:pimeloyl-ACP methyl ester carboxylesterase
VTRVGASSKRVVRANGVDLCVETFGDPASPALLLVAGAGQSMDWWEDELCERLADGSRFVLRYDQRDTGESVSYEPSAAPYTGADLVADAFGVLDALGIAHAHIVGVSTGGGIAQHVALVAPGRVLSLTLVATSAAAPRDPGRPALPPPSPRLATHFADLPPQPDWTDREAVIDYVVADQLAYEGSVGSDDSTLRALVARVVDRTARMESSMTNLPPADEGEPVRGGLGDIRTPTLVVHGTEDPLFPLAHGEALAAEIPGARLLALDGMGHQIPPQRFWDRVVPEILGHTADER